MDNLMDLPRIGSDDDWLDLRDGDQGLVRGRLYGPLRPGHESLIVSTTSWEVISVTIRGGYEGPGRDAGTSVTVLATRCEDGLEMNSDDILVHEEEK